MKFKHLLLCIITSLLLTSCVGSKSVVQQSGRVALSAQQRFRFDAIYYEAVNQQLAGRYASAYELLTKALEIDSTAAEAHLCMAEILEAVRTSRDTTLLHQSNEHLRLAAHYAPNTTTYLKKYADKLLEEKRYEDALPAFEKLAKLSANSKIYYDLAKTYTQLARYEEAHTALNHIANMEGEIYPVIEMRANIYNVTGDTTALFAYLEKACNENTDDIQIFKLHLEYSLDYKHTKFIEQDLMTRLEKNPENPDYQMGLFFLYAFKELDDNTPKWDILKRIACNSLIDEEERCKFINMVADQLLTEEKSLEPIFTIYDTAIYTDLKTSKLPQHYAYLLNKQQAPRERMLPVLLRAKEIEPENEDNYYTLAAYYKDIDNTDKIIEVCREAQYSIPGNLLFYFWEAYYLNEDSDPTAAIEILERGLQHNTNTEHDLLITTHNWLGDKYYDLGKKELAYEHYEKVLAIDPYDVSTLNNYAYYLSLEEDSLDYAEEMGTRLLDIEPNNPTYLDTYAWILYKQGKFTQAQIYIDKTLEAADKEDYDSAVLFDHAGDIYLALGEKQKACLHWIKALELTTEPSERKAIHKKIKRYARPPISIPKL